MKQPNVRYCLLTPESSITWRLECSRISLISGCRFADILKVSDSSEPRCKVCSKRNARTMCIRAFISVFFSFPSMAYCQTICSPYVVSWKSEFGYSKNDKISLTPVLDEKIHDCVMKDPSRRWTIHPNSSKFDEMETSLNIPKKLESDTNFIFWIRTIPMDMLTFRSEFWTFL